MFRTMLTSKIHRATVTQADLHYVGSITIDSDLMEAADLLPGEQVTVVDINNGARLETYAIPGPAGSGVIGINGAAARLVQPGDLVIIIAYGIMDDAEARRHTPKVLFVDAENRIIGRGGDPAEALPGELADAAGAAAGGLVRGDTIPDQASARPAGRLGQPAQGSSQENGIHPGIHADAPAPARV